MKNQMKTTFFLLFFLICLAASQVKAAGVVKITTHVVKAIDLTTKFHTKDKTVDYYVLGTFLAKSYIQENVGDNHRNRSWYYNFFTIIQEAKKNHECLEIIVHADDNYVWVSDGKKIACPQDPPSSVLDFVEKLPSFAPASDASCMNSEVKELKEQVTVLSSQVANLSKTLEQLTLFLVKSSAAANATSPSNS
jgi:hypothetical protein